MLENYGKSYTNGATEFSGGDNVWPHAYDATPSGEQSIEDYTNEKYFKIHPWNADTACLQKKNEWNLFKKVKI
jgi:hypothetical protein